MRVESDRPMENGGFLHLNPDADKALYIHKNEPSKPTIDWKAKFAEWGMSTTVDKVIAHGESLGVDPMALKLLGIAWAEEHRAWAYPMCDGTGKVTGARIRNEHSDKWAHPGSRQGLFIPEMEHRWRMFVAEGPTDTAAALTIGLYCIGRPSCNGCEQMVVDMCKWLWIKEVVIIADRDTPGQLGAEKLQDRLKVKSIIYTPDGKDIRECVKNGLTAELVNLSIKDQQWTYPK